MPGTYPVIGDPRFLKPFAEKIAGKNYYYLAKAPAKEMKRLQEAKQKQLDATRKYRHEEAERRKRQKEEQGGAAKRTKS